ncbi:MAG: DUF3800 domain-containing protein [Chloroflexota bacterium]|nr:DUF3800 domain-containing protein [Chloroflexota bacterium]
MLVFIDESGTIHPNDPNPVSVLMAVCMPERIHRALSRQLYSLERTILGNKEIGELKGSKLINRRTFRRIPEKRELVEGVFDLIRNLDIVTFAIVIPRPTQPLNLPDGHLPSPHIFLLQRINSLAEKMNQEAVLIYDGNGMNVQGISMASCVRNYIFRVAEYNNILRRIVDTPLFVDSLITPGIQLADLAASVVRQYEEQFNLSSVNPQGDVYLAAIARYYRAVRSKTEDGLLSESQHSLYGFYKMREEQLYQQDEE